jgi:CRISPR-associated endoribonuclease Cas6
MPIEVPANVRQVEFTALQYVLQFETDFDFSLATLLQLRREFRRTIDWINHATGDSQRFRELLTPQRFVDPVARRRFRSPSPGFILQLPAGTPTQLEAGDELVLPVLFLGKSRAEIPLFSELLEALGRSGMAGSEGIFSLQGIRSVSHPAGMELLWTTGACLADLSIPYQELGWWLDQRNFESSLTLSLLTPARLLRGNKPLFAADFHRLFPFALRRVTSLLYTWADCEPEVDIQELLVAAEAVDTLENGLFWSDWRVLDGSPHQQSLGGLLGQIKLGGKSLSKLVWVLGLLELFGIGKGATYGAGQCSVLP